MTPGLMKPVAKAPKPASLISDLLMSIRLGVGKVRGFLVPGAVMISGQGINPPCLSQSLTTSPLHLQHPETLCVTIYLTYCKMGKIARKR